MPHIIVEYSANVNLDVPAVLRQLHESLASNGVDIVRIKTRAVKIENYIVGDKGPGGSMIHGTLLLLEGRDVPTRKKLSEPLYAILKEAAGSQNCAVTFEAREMDKETYYL